ncbi:MAG: hypothetical protein J6L00_04550 [Clostridia bacterium]|nr:hypothetical protein [Clostridia bacterium]
MASCGAVTAVAKDADSSVLAHWKLQNNKEYYKGDISKDTLQFYDLSGNGNDLEVAVEGNGSQLDTFTWDSGVVRTETGLKVGDSKASALKMNNSLTLAKSVDPYTESQTSYSGAYVSGKYLQTVANAPLNKFEGKDGWTIEIIFKVSEDWDNRYNRYTGIFSRQGVVAQQNEPALSVAMAAAPDGSTRLGTDTKVGLQYVHIDTAGHKTNQEHSSVSAEKWYHYMVTGDGQKTTIYVNGVVAASISENAATTIVNPAFRWEVGVGRKIPESGDKTKNTLHAEGLIRRLFCGSISEIRVSEGEMSVKDSLYYTSETDTDTTTRNRKTAPPKTTTKKGETGTTVQNNGGVNATNKTTVQTVPDGNTSHTEDDKSTDTTKEDVETNDDTQTVDKQGETDAKPHTAILIIAIVAGVLLVGGIVTLIVLLLKTKKS